MSKAKVLVSDKLSDAGLGVLKGATGIEVDYKPGLSEAQLCEIIGSYAGLVIRSATTVTANVIEAAHSLKVIGRAGIGVDNVDIPAASKRGIVVMNTPTGNAVTTAEHAITLMMSLARKIPQANASMRQGKWEKTAFQGRELTDKTLGIIGLGNIGRIVADRARGLKMNIIGADPVISAEKAAEIGVELVSLDELYARADVITLHTPLTAETRGLFNDATFAKLKKGVLLVNAARGGIIDELALKRAIESGKVAGAALDVFEKEPIPADYPLLPVDAVVLTPHLGASTHEAQDRVALEIAHQVAEFLQHGTVKNAVNVPALPADRAQRIGPYLGMARRLGLLVGQLGSEDVREFRVTCTGEAGDLGVTPIAHEALAGFFAPRMEETVNSVSAPYEAKERGIKIVEVREPTSGVYASSVRVSVTGKAGIHTATGAIGNRGEARLVGLEGYDVDAVLDGVTLIMRNQDRPGVIGAVGTELGKRKINIASMQVSLDAESGEALSLWNVSTAVPDDALEALRKLENVRAVLAVKL